MATLKKFEEINAWQKARELCKDIFLLIEKGAFKRDFELINQINKSSGSVMDNIAEVFDRGSNLEFIQFLGYAKGSASEVKSHLFRALDRNYIDNEILEKLYKLADEIGKMIRSLIEYLNKSEIRGSKFKDRVVH